MCPLRPELCRWAVHRRTEFGFTITGHHRCNVVVTYPVVRRGNKCLPSVGGLEGRQGERASGLGGRASFTLYVLLGPSLAVGLALAGFSATSATDGQALPASPSAATESPLATATNGSASPSTASGPAPAASATLPATPGTRTSAPSVPATAAPTAPPSRTTTPTVPPPTPAPTSSTPTVPSLPPLPTPTLPGLP